ncbi:hypothetical protein BS78_08G096100 [Paspalum vaginatum]|nr:hypothetical protein BS78_08G096100 [Paspalum vaginatum]
MYPLSVLLILVTAGIPAVYGHPAAAGTPAARFWEEALPGTPMPGSIADLVQEGIDHSPLGEHYSVRWEPATGNSNYLDTGNSNYLNTGNSNYLDTGNSNYVDTGNSNYAHPTSSSGTATLPAGLFFLKAQLHVGSTMAILFQPAAVSPILPRDVAQKVPFGNISDALARFNIAPKSVEAAVVRETISLCETSAMLPGEKKACATSLEGTVQSAMDMVGSTQAVWAASSVLPRAGLPLQRYVMQTVTPLDGDRHVACHNKPYPYAVYFCHSTGSPTNAYIVSLSSLSGGPQLTMAAICHLDTSKWNPEHPAFKMLHTQPGGAPVCHYMLYASLVFGQKAANKP